MFTDYSSLLMDVEQATKRLSDGCLDKKYDGHMDEISLIKDRLNRLAVWIAEQKEKESRRESPSV